MRLSDLNKLYWLKKDIERRYSRIEELDAEATRTTALLSDMPKSKGVEGARSRIIDNIIDEKMMILLKTEELEIERRKIEYMIDEIKDAKIKYYMRMRFIELLSWQQISNKCGNNITADAIRKAVNRYMKKQ